MLCYAMLCYAMLCYVQSGDGVWDVELEAELNIRLPSSGVGGIGGSPLNPEGKHMSNLSSILNLLYP